jgi:HD-GYP domain-containing protein (c-di-GMP phosphodiesterase class II)
MRLVATSAFPEGVALGMDLPARPGQAPLMRAGVTLGERHREALRACGITWVYVEDELGEGIEIPLPLSPATRMEARAALTRTFAEAARMPGNLLSYERLDELTAAAKRIVAEVETLPDAPYAFADLCGPDAYAIEHAIDATVIGLLVGRHLFRTRGRLDYKGDRRYDVPSDLLLQLGLGLFLQDIGKAALPPNIVYKSGPLADDEWELMRRHPELGLAFLRDEGIGLRAKSVVRSHHERWDGEGYPSGLAGEEISQFARVAAVADVFDAITSERHYSPAQPQNAGVSAISEGAGSAFDPEIASVFADVVSPHPPGSEIELPDGRLGVVAAVDENGPVVRVAGDELPLAEAA